MVFNTLNSVACNVNFTLAHPWLFIFIFEGEGTSICETFIHIKVNDSPCITAKYLYRDTTVPADSTSPQQFVPFKTSL